MSSLVADFLINPVLRQARRFSRTNTLQGHIDPLANERIPYDVSDVREGLAVFEADESLRTDILLGEERVTFVGSVSGGPTLSSPVEDGRGLEREVEGRRSSRSLSTSRTITASSAVPRRLASFPPARIGVVDDATTPNPDFGVPNRFDTASPTSSFGSSVYNPRMNPSQGPGTPPQVLSLPTTSTSGPRMPDSSLPEDDGMGNLRRRIIAIQLMDISAASKARLMHELLTEGYSHTQISQQAKRFPRVHSPASLVSQDRPTTPVSSSFGFWQTTTNETPPDSSPTYSLHTFHLSPDDLRPTYTPIEFFEATTSDSGESEEVQREPALGCPHYKRNVKLQCFTCEKWYTCRFCHDEVESHVLNRKETRNMLCMLCMCAQRAGEVCVKCGARAAWYYCGVCHLWDDDTTKSIYHCNDCGICRVGRGIGKDFFHCKTCDVCIKISGEFTHKCIERASDCDCPICGEYLFSSPKSVCFMKCGHSIHRTCYDDLMETSYKCPICSQSIVNMETQFRNLDRAIDGQPMPAQFRDTKAMVSCNDCYAKSLVKYHWLGVKCAVCDSYNTTQLQILTHADEDDIVHTRTVALHPLIVSPEVPGDSNLLPEPRGRHFVSSGSRSRRHSSHVQPMSTEAISPHLTPYELSERIGRSVSPMRGSSFFDTPMAGVDSMQDVGLDDQEDLEFWGGGSLTSPNNASGHDDEYEEDEQDSQDSVSMNDDGDEDGEEEDRIQLFGHR